MLKGVRGAKLSCIYATPYIFVKVAKEVRNYLSLSDFAVFDSLAQLNISDE